MIRHEEECRREYREHMRDGQGTVELLHLIQNDGELNDKGRLFSKITLKPGCSIGNHMHEKDAELFYILKGCPEYSDNGTVVTLKPGDVTICPAGSSHSVANNTDEVVELVALVLYK